MFDFKAASRQLFIQRHIEAGNECDERFAALLVQRYRCTNSDAIVDIKAVQKRLKGNRSSRAYYHENRDREIVQEKNRRCARLGIPGIIALNDWLELCERYNYRCAACDDSKPLTIDHIRPIGRGGTNWIENIQPLCKGCNCRKNDRYEEE